jgi:hypothetical protein
MNLIDKTIAVFSPQKALNREVARKRLEILANYGNYGANQQKKSMIGWQTRSQSPDEDIVKFIPLLRERSRDLFAGVRSGSVPNSEITPFGLMILLSSFHITSNGIAESQSHAITSNGGSVRIKSTLPSGISFILSKQSPFIKFTLTICVLLK